MKKLLSISLLAGLLIVLPGCSCEREEETSEIAETAPVHLQEDFVGPTTEPFSVGPDGPPPVN